MGCISYDLESFGDSELVNELESRGYEVYDVGSGSDAEFTHLYGMYVSGRDVSQDLVKIMIERAGRII